MPKSFDSSRVLANLRGANKEAQGRYLGDVAQRERAARILNPSEVAGDYDAGRLLSTTLGGYERPITTDDLRAFRQNVQTLGKRFRGGITAKDVVNLSLQVDRERANEQIKTAVPVQFLGGRVHFITNASRHSEDTRHHVHIELLNYSAAVSSPAKPEELVKLMTTGPLKFDCDCGRHRYWFRYIATIGRFNAGRDETGFPKVRNPRLVGVACKHVLRVMQQLASPMMKLQAEKMIEAGRKTVERKPRVLSKKEAAEIAEQQAKQAGWKRNTVESAVERQRRISQQRAVQAVVQRSNMALKGMTPRKIDAAKRAFELNARKLAGMGVLTPAQLNAMLAKLKA